VREFRCFPPLLRTITVFTGVHSPFRVADVVKESATSRARRRSLPRKGPQLRKKARIESTGYAVRILRMARGANKRHERLVRRFSCSKARFVVLISRLAAGVCARNVLGRMGTEGREGSSGHAGRGNVSYAKSWPMHRKIQTVAKSGA